MTTRSIRHARSPIKSIHSHNALEHRLRNLSLLFPALALAIPLAAQQAPPPNFASGEIARSQACVPALTRLMALDEQVAPLAARAERIQALNVAINLEDVERAEPFAADDPVEEAVQAWFATDMELALSGSSDAIQEERSGARDGIRAVLLDALEALNQERIQILDGVENLQEMTFQCGGAVLVRSAVLDTCGDASSVVCEQARAEEPGGSIRFVDSAEDLWDVEELRPWSRPGPIGIGVAGNLSGAQTSAYVRRGNIVLVVSLETMVLERSTLSDEEVAEFEDYLTEMGFTFQHPRFVMSPVLGVYFEGLTEPLGGETHYVLHFGDLQDPVNDLIWNAPVQEGPVEVTFAPGEAILTRLLAGEEVRFTAMTLKAGEDAADEGIEANAVYSLDVLNLGQADSVRSLLTYVGGGQLARDLSALIPTDDTGNP